jgi:DNA-binding phage protein
LENKTGNVTIQTVLKVFNALGAKVNFQVQMDDEEVDLA